MCECGEEKPSQTCYSAYDTRMEEKFLARGNAVDVARYWGRMSISLSFKNLINFIYLLHVIILQANYILLNSVRFILPVCCF